MDAEVLRRIEVLNAGRFRSSESAGRRTRARGRRSRTCCGYRERGEVGTTIDEFDERAEVGRRDAREDILAGETPELSSHGICPEAQRMAISSRGRVKPPAMVSLRWM